MKAGIMMRDFNLRELQKCELDVLKEFVRICKKHNLKYYLAWGTLLGAVRHQGFIPWDDDIDVCMPYDDYNRFKELCKTELASDYYYQDWEKENDFFLPWAKVRKNNTTCMTRKESELKIHWGVGIDVFPLMKMEDDKCPFSKKLAKTLLFFIVQRSYLSLLDDNVAKKIKKIIYALIPAKWDEKIVNRCMLHLNKIKNQHRFYWNMSMYFEKRSFPVDVFGEGKEYLFEDIMLNCPQDVQAYLSQIYGEDYMAIPKVEDRVNHGDIIVDLKKDYSCYQSEEGHKE